MGVTYDINDPNNDHDKPEEVLFKNLERLTELSLSVQQGLNDHNTLESLKNGLLGDLNLAWEGQSKNKFDDFMQFFQYFLNDLRPAIKEYKNVLENVGKLGTQASGETPSTKKKVSEVQVP